MNLPETLTVAVLLPSIKIRGGIDSIVTGVRFSAEAAATVTAIVCVVVKLPSLAVTVIVAFPTPTGVMVT